MTDEKEILNFGFLLGNLLFLAAVNFLVIQERAEEIQFAQISRKD